MCPKKVASYYNNDPDAIWIAVTRYRDKGAGKWLDSKQLHDLWEATYKAAIDSNQNADKELITPVNTAPENTKNFISPLRNEITPT